MLCTDLAGLDVEDVDVKTEREVTNNILASCDSQGKTEEALIVHELSKSYGSFQAVDNLTFR